MLKMYHSHAHRGGSPDFWEDNWSQVNIDEALRYCEFDPLRPLLESYALPGTRMLEGGCGSGHYVAFYSAKGVNIIGLDFAQGTLRGLRRKFSNLRLCSGDVAQLPFQDESFDVYYSGGVVEHFESGAEEALQEARRVLRRDGVLLISVPYFSPLRRFLLPLRKDWRRVSGAKSGDASGNGNFFQYAYTKSEFKNLLRASGFRVIASQGYSILWGLSELPFVSNLLGKWQSRKSREQTAVQTGDPSQVSLPDKGRLPLIKKVMISEDSSTPITGVVVRVLRWASANMMMYVCLPDEHRTNVDR